MEKKLYIITNESFYHQDNNYYCDNIDLKSIPEGLSKYSETYIIGRKSNVFRSKKVEIQKITILSNIFSYLFSLMKSFRDKKSYYLIISISPYTFFASLFLKIFFKKHFIYLRSDGYEEYKAILGFIGPFIYHLMFSIAAVNSNLISCRKHILKNKKGEIVHPSQLNKKWFAASQDLDFKKIKLLYVGRIRVEKGIYSLLKIIKNSELELTVVTPEKDIRVKSTPKNVTIVNCENYNDSIIEFYDKNCIFILPSFTEGHPQVLDEALARNRPVIIFKEISHVLRDRKGIFISNRDTDSLMKTIRHIEINYEKIKEEMKKNKLPMKENFIIELKNIILRN